MEKVKTLTLEDIGENETIVNRVIVQEFDDDEDVDGIL